MEIFGIGKNYKIPEKRKINNKKQQNFISLLEDSDSDDQEKISDIEFSRSMPSCNPFISLNEYEFLDDEEIIKRGNDILNLLNKLRISIITGQLNFGQISQLKFKLNNLYNSTFNPELKKIIEEIILRAEVEVAKLEKSY